jgi:hypothetical protein
MFYILTNEDDTTYSLNDYKIVCKWSSGLNKINNSDFLVFHNLNNGIDWYIKKGNYIRILLSLSYNKINRSWTNLPSIIDSWTNVQSIIDSVILSDRYFIYDPKTIKKFNLCVDENFISAVCRDGYVNVLEWWKTSGLPLKYDELALDCASMNNKVNVLEWWLKSGLPLKYSENALDYASSNGSIDALDWWVNSGLELKYTKYALHKASLFLQINVLDWWYKSGLSLQYDDNVLGCASQNSSTVALEWWYKSNLPLQCSAGSLRVMLKSTFDSYHIPVNIIEWWYNVDFTYFNFLEKS